MSQHTSAYTLIHHLLINTKATKLDFDGPLSIEIGQKA